MIAGPVGPLECLSTGSGPPRTVFVHGLGGTVRTTRPFGSGVVGEKTFLHLRGFGRSGLGNTGEPGGPPWNYRELAADLAAVAAHHHAGQALGVSMGAGAICALLCQEPARFERVVLVLPAVIDQPRTGEWLDRLVTLKRLNEAHDVEGMGRLLSEEQPVAHRDRQEFRSWVREHVEALASPGGRAALRALPSAVPVPDRALLGRVTADVLVVGQLDDSAHPASVAEELAGLFRKARVVILPAGGVLWGHRDRFRELVAGFLG